MKQGAKSKRTLDDPYPSDGFGVFADDKLFREFLKKHGHLNQVS
jgi:hypothetical protein